MSASKLSDVQKEELVAEYRNGKLQRELAEKYGIGTTTVAKIVGRAGGRRNRTHFTSVSSITEFTKRVKSALWRQDGGVERKTYNLWGQRVKEFEKLNGLSYPQAVVQASKEFPCLRKLFREFNVGLNDPDPNSHPDIHHFGRPVPGQGVECEGRELSHRENLAWAIEMAGEFLRTKREPISCPNNAAYYLYRQARAEPKDFLSKFNQIEAKGFDDLEDRRLARKGGERSIAEIDFILSMLDQPETGEENEIPEQSQNAPALSGHSGPTEGGPLLRSEAMEGASG